MTKGEVSRAAALMGRKGGRARLTTMTADERVRIAKLGAEARWKDQRKKRQSQ